MTMSDELVAALQVHVVSKPAKTKVRGRVLCLRNVGEKLAEVKMCDENCVLCG